MASKETLCASAAAGACSTLPMLPQL